MRDNKIFVFHRRDILPIHDQMADLGPHLERRLLVAAHVAIATTAGMDYLLTWNCRHIANAQLLKQLDRVCTRSGYRLPAVCTPEELLGGNANV